MTSLKSSNPEPVQTLESQTKRKLTNKNLKRDMCKTTALEKHSVPHCDIKEKYYLERGPFLKQP